MPPPVITFLSDYGLSDEFVGTCHAVIATICPDARIIDLDHGTPRHDVRAGALTLLAALPYLPVGVHLAVVDPDVGAERRAIALRTDDGRLFVGPDNGLLTLAAQAIVEAVDIAHSRFRLQPVSATFHGRDIFAPVAAQLAAGQPLAEAGRPCDPDALVTLPLPRARRQGDTLVAHVLSVDRFGNAQLDAGHEDLAELGLRLGHRVRLEVGEREAHRPLFVRTFADVGVGELLLYEDSRRRLALAVGHGNAAELLAIGVDDELRIRLA